MNVNDSPLFAEINRRFQYCRDAKAKILRQERRELRAQGYTVIGDPLRAVLSGDVWPESVRNFRAVAVSTGKDVG